MRTLNPTSILTICMTQVTDTPSHDTLFQDTPLTDCHDTPSLNPTSILTICMTQVTYPLMTQPTQPTFSLNPPSLSTHHADAESATDVTPKEPKPNPDPPLGDINEAGASSSPDGQGLEEEKSGSGRTVAEFRYKPDFVRVIFPQFDAKSTPSHLVKQYLGMHAYRRIHIHTHTDTHSTHSNTRIHTQVHPHNALSTLAHPHITPFQHTLSSHSRNPPLLSGPTISHHDHSY